MVYCLLLRLLSKYNQRLVTLLKLFVFTDLFQCEFLKHFFYNLMFTFLHILLMFEEHTFTVLHYCRISWWKYLCSHIYTMCGLNKLGNQTIAKVVSNFLTNIYSGNVCLTAAKYNCKNLIRKGYSYGLK